METSTTLRCMTSNHGENLKVSEVYLLNQINKESNQTSTGT